MTMSTDLFRREALEYWTRQQGPGALLRVGVPWVRRLYWVVLALAAGGLALAFLVRIDLTTSGPALVDPQQQTFVAAVPAAGVSDLQQGRSLRIEVDTPTGTQTVTGTAQRVEAAEDAGVTNAGFRSFPPHAVLVTGALVPGTTAPTTSPSPSRLTGRATVTLGSQQAFSLFVHGFHGARGGHD
jgi:hypothetical protein